MPVINTNVKSLIASNALAINDRKLQETMTQLSTGSRINSAKDDAAGLAISQKMTAQINGLNQAVRNANDGIAMLQTVEGATGEITNMLQRMRELAVQASNDTNTSDDRAALDGEYQQLSKEITRIADTTQWNGMNVMNNTQVGTGNVGDHTRDVAFQVGANANQTIDIKLKDFSFGTGTAATPSEQLLNLQVGGSDDLTAADTFTLKIGSTTFTAVIGTAVAGTSADGTETEAIKTALATAINSTVGFENVSVTRSGSTISIKDGEGRAIADFGASAAGTPATVATVETTVVAGAPAAGATAPNTKSVFGSSARLNDTTLLDSSHANAAMGALDQALSNVNAERATMGAVMSRLQHAADNLTNVSQNATESRSRVMDTDYALATTKLSKGQIIQQAATAMLAQANQQPQSVLALLK